MCKGILNNVFDISFVYVDNVMDNNKVFMSYFFSFYPSIVVVLFLLTFTFLFLLRLSFLHTITFEKPKSFSSGYEIASLGMFAYPCTE